MSRIGAGILFGAFGIAALLPLQARADLAIEIVSIEQAPQRNRHQDVRQANGKIVDHVSSR
jgi:hypothetical protein